MNGGICSVDIRRRRRACNWSPKSTRMEIFFFFFREETLSLKQTWSNLLETKFKQREEPRWWPLRCLQCRCPPLYRRGGMGSEWYKWGEELRKAAAVPRSKAAKIALNLTAGLWGLVNNAGKSIPVGINEWLTKEDFAKVLDVNLLGLIDVTLQMLPLVRRAKGRLVNISSVVGRLACGGGGYSISKYGVEAFSDTLRREISPFGMKVSIIEPGTFRTSISQPTIDNFQTSWNKALSETKEVYGQLYFDNLLKIVQNIINHSNKNLFLVTNCIEHALTSRYPRARYSCGLDAKLFYLPMSYLPSSVADFIVTYTWPKPAQVGSG
ncbi:retinol dehydrogenase 7-like isoform X3 [Thamnophis elegans]|uniref:retinol dehydrogenase 7-like isoform X3 n=1 Tax=Thamnophis elegans TaxID=35005 RepID=UPI001377BA2F|nr:retinol dehydrogenase 7-like isoform X3 [Thamnophis elegans]